MCLEQTSEAARHYSTVEAQAREIARLTTQLAQSRSRQLDQSHDYDREVKDLQAQLDSMARKHTRDLQEQRTEFAAEKKKREIQCAFSSFCSLPFGLLFHIYTNSNMDTRLFARTVRCGAVGR